ncbi:MAG TPA: alkaline phosphatase family protein [Solirubrobacteraceae bacterium]|jgi:predicted AlkP superfamily pyrophosphatase or phosphodiesterase
MPEKTVVLCTVAMTPELLGDATPRLKSFADGGAMVPLGGVTPAVTAAVQSTYLTGLPPSGHGAVGNGWLFRDTMEVRLWQQSNRLVQAPKVWEAAPGVTCANLCWWFAMYSSADVTVTPRPMYPADGRKIPDCYTKPGDLRDRLQAELGQFPLFKFWGPAASIDSTKWIAAAAKLVDAQFNPTLSLVYLPHLDYDLQKKGPALPEIRGTLGELDAVAGDLIDFYEGRGARVIVLSEYGIVPVSRPVHPNRILRSAGLVAYRMELGREVIDIGGSEAFAMADHQIAHVYVRDPARVAEVRTLFDGVPGVGEVLDEAGKREYGLDHERSGELVLIAEPDSWFTYYYWEDDAKAPDYARTVDIHRKPGYDPVELFLDPAIRVPPLAIGSRLIRKKLGFRTLLDVIPTDASLVRGSHGRIPDDPSKGPLLMTRSPELLGDGDVAATDVHDLILRHLGVGALAAR